VTSHDHSVSAALQAVARLLAAAPGDIRATLLDEAQALLGATAAALVPLDGPARTLAATDAPEYAALLEGGATTLLIVPLADEALLLGGSGFSTAQVELASAFAAAAGATLGRGRAAAEQARRAERHAALTRAAKSLHESLDLETLLTRICREARAILDADLAVVYRGTLDEGLHVAATAGAPPEMVGIRLEPGIGLAGKVLQSGRPMLTNDYLSIADLPSGSPFERYQASLAIPFEWSEELRGIISVGYARPQHLTQDDLALLATFAEFAAAACRNASLHAAIAEEARTDGLTGCLNHAALHESLLREIERAARVPGRDLSLILLDLNDFKQVNEEHGHLIGDEVLRRIGFALRGGTRPYDIAARYGGDEFALLAVEADEEQAAEIAGRTIERIAAAAAEFSDVSAGGATAGVAEWAPGLSATQLIANADRALLQGKHHGGRGEANLFSELPDVGSTRRFESRFGPAPAAPAVAPAWPETHDEAAERLRKRTRQLAAANALGTRVSAMTDVQEILNAVVEELHRAFGYYCCEAVRVRPDGQVESAAGRGDLFLALASREWTQPREVGLIGRCLREGRPVVVGDVTIDPDFRPTPETLAVRSELVVPLYVAGELWGVLNVEDLEVGAFHEDDVRLMETMADQAGSALRSAALYERLERAYMGTAEALAAALEAKDASTAHHARSIVAQAEAVGRRLGMDAQQLRDLRFGAVFHDIGKIAVPEQILNKHGMLTAEERAQIERHTVVGEQILAPVEFLAGARLLVRHEHERWDGRGYPDRLAGTSIPLGSRIILACDAFHAMTSDRPYRRAMSAPQAWGELQAHAGTQFDERVVEALLDIIGAATAPPVSLT
jgi:diguanylate cyclase (GGDEF)-like protein